MVDTVGWKAGGPVARVTPIAPSTPGVAASATGNAPAATDTAATASPGLAKSMAASAPVDTDRVAQIKRAIAEGRFPISPSTIADRLIALRLSWVSDDKA